MKIALIATIDKSINSRSKGGTEVWAYQFCKEASKKGHKIDLFASGDSSIDYWNVDLISVVKESFANLADNDFFNIEDPIFTKRKTALKTIIYSKIMFEIKKKENQYDLIINSTGNTALSYIASDILKPTFVVFHAPVDSTINFYTDIFGFPQNNYLILLSNYQLLQLKNIPTDRCFKIPNGIDIDDLKFHEIGNDNLCWLSRVDKNFNKGLEQAVIVAESSKRKLIASGYIEKTSMDFFDNLIKPKIGEYTQFESQSTDSYVDKNQFFGNSKAFLFPIQWEEPFGLVIVEAMATGTPVIAFSRGAVPEIIKDGETGFIVNSSDSDIRGDFIIKKTGIEGLCEAVERIYAMPEEEYAQMRRNCRAHVEKNFTVERMVDNYEKVYNEIVSRK